MNYQQKVSGNSMFPRINSSEFIVLKVNIVPCTGDELLGEQQIYHYKSQSLAFNSQIELS